MQICSKSRKYRAAAALAGAAIATVGSIETARGQSMAVSTSASTDYQYETQTIGQMSSDDTYINGSGHFEIDGSGYQYSDWGVMSFTAPQLGAGQFATGLASDSVVLQVTNYGSAYDSPTPVTLSFFMTTDTTTNVTAAYPTAGALTYDIGNNSHGNPIVGGFDTVAGDPGTFTSVIPVGTATYSQPTGAASDGQVLTYTMSFAGNSALASYVATQVNSGGLINLIVATNETDSDMAAFYSGNAGTVTQRPELNFTVTTTNQPSNSSVLYAGAYSPSNTSKAINVTIGTPEIIPSVNGTGTVYCVLASGSTPTTATVSLSNGGPAGNSLTYSLTGNGATANTPGGPISSQSTGSAIVGFNPTDFAPLISGNTPATGSVTATNLSAYSPQDPAVTININSTVTSLALQERFVDSAEGATGSSTPTPSLGKVLVKNSGGTFATYSYNQSSGIAIPISTTNPVGLTDYGPDALTTLTLLNNSVTTPAPFAYDAPFYNTTDPEAAALQANTNGIGNQLFNTNNTGYVNVAITPMLSGTYGSDTSQTEGAFTSANTPPYMSFAQASITGMGLVGENDSMRVYVQWSAYDPATVTSTGPAAALSSSNGFTTTATLSNAVDMTNVVTSDAQTFNNGLAAAAWVSGTPTFNQTWSGGPGWGTSGLTADTEPGGSTITNGTVLNPDGSTTTFNVNFNPTNQMINGTYGSTLSVPLENEQDITGAAPNDLPAATYSVQATVNDAGGTGSGTYTLNGGTLSAPATTLGGSFTQTGGTSIFASIANSGSVSITGGSATFQSVSGNGTFGLGGSGSATIGGGKAKFSAMSTTGGLTVTGGTAALVDNVGTAVLGSLAIGSNGTLDIGNNRIIIDYSSPLTDPITSIAAWIKNGFYGLAGPQIISSDIAADDTASGLSYGIGYADGADGTVAGLPSGEIEIMFTLLGDANLDGIVNSEDFTPFSANVGKNGSWDQGDFNYDGTVNSEDFTPFSANLGKSASLAAAGGLESADSLSLANVPEPASIGLLAAGTFGLLARRRRQRQ